MLKSLLRTLVLIFCATTIAISAKYYLPLQSLNLADIKLPFFLHHINSPKILTQPSFSESVDINQTNFNITTETNNIDLANNHHQFSSITEFPLGWIDRIEKPETPAQVANEGINLLIPYTHSYQQETIETYLDAAQKNGIKVFLEPYRESVKAGDTNAVTEFVRTYKQHPAVAGWYAFDEPNVHKVSPQTLEITYQAIKAEDPNHPVAVVFATQHISKVPPYWNAMDICMIDRYPIFFNKHEFNNLADFGEWMQEAAYYAGNKPFWPVLQGFGEQEDGKPKYRRGLPTAAEERYMFYTAVVAGADGLIFYGHHWTQQSWVDSVLTPIITEFREYLSIIGANNLAEKPLANRADIQAIIYPDPSSQKKLLIAVHHGRGKVKASIDLESLTSVSLVKVLGENREIKPTRSMILDDFGSYDVHIYEIS